MDSTSSGWRKLINILSQLDDKKDIEELLVLLLTYDERQDLGKRVLIVQSLRCHKESQREMSQHLQVSIAKITRGSNALKEISKRLNELLNEKF